jgi:hypothetical protein
VNLLLEVALSVTLLTGVLSWAVGTGWARWWTVAHAVAALSLVVLAPGKLRGSVRIGMRRRRWTRWVSAAFGILIVATACLGVLHATGLWYGVGYWSALWTHVAFAFASVPLFVWHLRSRPGRARAVDLDRRFVLRAAGTVAVAGTAVAAIEGVVRVAGLEGGDRRATGSHEIASFQPSRMPVVSWLDDRTPCFDRTSCSDRAGGAVWSLRVAGRPVELDELIGAARPLVADLDCTGGWWSRQRWDVVPVADLLGERSERSFTVTSHTGYRRTLPMRDASRAYLAVGYDGAPLRPGHGARVRLVAPGRRGYWWVKWVVDVEPTDRPWWLQLPFPAT